MPQLTWPWYLHTETLSATSSGSVLYIYHLQALTSQFVLIYAIVKISFILLQESENLVLSLHLSFRLT